MLGIEPSLHAPKARVLPVYDTPYLFIYHIFTWLAICVILELMTIKNILSQFNIIGQCKQYRLPLLQCPQFIFLIMGIVISVTALVTYALGTHYVADPALVSIIVLILTVILFVITFSVTRTLEGLAEANRLKSEFISVVSHQLRSPLSNLKWGIEILLSERFGKVDEKQLEYLKILQENSDRMGELVSDLLMVSRIEQGRLPLQKTEFSLEDLTKNMVNFFKPLAEASNVKIELEANPSLPKVFADSDRLKVVIENLIDNAIRYIKEQGEVRINIGQNGKQLLFQIKDNGVGIPKEDQKHIFQRFFRSKNVLKYRTQGSGLGLNIAKSIVEMSGGKIWFQSRDGSGEGGKTGTIFYFTLPIKK